VLAKAELLRRVQKEHYELKLRLEEEMVQKSMSFNRYVQRLTPWNQLDSEEQHGLTLHLAH
jgi:hypothetical protein